MATTTMSLLLCALLCTALPLALAGGAGGGATTGGAKDLKFQDLKDAGAAGQFSIKTSIGYSDQPAAGFTPNTCATPVMGACFNSDKPAPFNVPLLSMGIAQIKVDYALKSTVSAIKTYDSVLPMYMEFKMCYSHVASALRAYRSKNKAFTELTDNCPFTIGNVPWPDTVTSLEGVTAAEQAALTGSFVFNMDKLDNIPTATLFIMTWVYCPAGPGREGGDGTEFLCAFATTESPQVNGTYTQPYSGMYVETERYNPVTTSLLVASIVLGCTGPIMFFVYFFADRAYFAKTGRPLAFA